jgi:hypothetical protein
MTVRSQIIFSDRRKNKAAGRNTIDRRLRHDVSGWGTTSGVWTLSVFPASAIEVAC